MNDPEHGAPISVGGSAVVDAADTALVIEARQLRRRLALVRRVLRGLLIFGFFGGCLAAIAVPSMSGFPCRGRQGEAKSALKSLYVAEESYRAEYDVYDESFARIGFDPTALAPRAGARYRYVVTDVVNTPGSESFVGWAFSTVDKPAGDVWRITDRNDLENVVNGCRR